MWRRCLFCSNRSIQLVVKMWLFRACCVAFPNSAFWGLYLGLWACSSNIGTWIISALYVRLAYSSCAWTVKRKPVVKPRSIAVHSTSVASPLRHLFGIHLIHRPFAFELRCRIVTVFAKFVVSVVDRRKNSVITSAFQKLWICLVIYLVHVCDLFVEYVLLIL